MSASLWRRVWNAIGFGSLTVIDDSGSVQTAQVRMATGELRDGVPVVQLFGLSGNAPADANAVLLFVGGDRSNAVVIATNHQSSRPTNQVAGENTFYNNFGMSIYLSQSGIIINGGGKPISIKNAPTVTQDGDFHATGAVIAGYGTANQAGLQTHKHNQPVDSHGDTEEPTDAPTPGT